MTEQVVKNNGIRQTILLYFCSAGIGAFGLMGLISFMSWLTICTFHEYSRYPNLYPFTIVFGIVCLVVFIVLILLWFIGIIKKQHKLRALGISFLFVFAGSIVGYFVFELLNVLSDSFLG